MQASKYIYSNQLWFLMILLGVFILFSSLEFNWYSYPHSLLTILLIFNIHGSLLSHHISSGADLVYIIEQVKPLLFSSLVAYINVWVVLSLSLFVLKRINSESKLLKILICCICFVLVQSLQISLFLMDLYFSSIALYLYPKNSISFWVILSVFLIVFTNYSVYRIILKVKRNNERIKYYQWLLIVFSLIILTQLYYLVFLIVIESSKINISALSYSNGYLYPYMIGIISSILISSGVYLRFKKPVQN